MLSVKIFGSVVLVGALFATAACSDSSKSLNPTAPSAVAAASLNIEAAAAIAESGATAGRGNPGKPENPGNGNGKGNGNGSGNDDRGNGNDDDKGKAPATTPPASNTPPPGNTTPGAPTPPTNPVTGKVEIEGLISAITGTSITVNGQVVTVPPGTVIRHGSRAVAFSVLAIGNRVHVKALRQATGLEATEVKLQNSGGDDDDGDDDDDDDDDDRVGTVRVSILDAAGSEAGDTAAFRLTRVASPALPLTSSLTVTFTLTGTATNGVDYTNIPVTVMFPAGQATVDVTVTPLADALAEAAESVVLTLTSVAPYVLGAPTTATVTIVNVGS